MVISPDSVYPPGRKLMPPKRVEIKASGELRKVMGLHFEEIRQAAEEGKGKVAWCTSVGPAELLHAFGFRVYFPENHGAILGTSRASADFIPLANAAGYSPEICSYLTSDIGGYLKKETPLKKLYGFKAIPKPDVLVYNTNQCRDVQDWFSFYQREFNVPLVGISTPHPVPALEESHIKGVESQIEALVEPLEKVAGTKLDLAALKKAVALSRECTDLWNDVLRTGSAVPSPLTFFDECIQMGPAVVMRGRQEAVDYYKLLLAEMKERVKDHVAAVEGEKLRLYWDGMPVWGRLRDLSEQFASLRACVVVSTYCNSWIFDELDASRPFHSMAKAYTKLFINRTEQVKQEYIRRLVRDFKADGIIFHDSKTCPNNANSRYGMPQRLSKEGIPTLVINGDLCDLRFYSDVQVRTSIEAFAEQLSEK
jgi:benzoyl-CoA reductase/2-hydroxyglutaryl-CoA dehydratase subunit BcrC/BadD/HgdB